MKTKPIMRLCLALAALFLLAAAPDQNSQILSGIQQDYWKHQLERSNYIRLTLGYPIESWEDVSEKGAKDEADFSGAILDRLHKIDLSALDHESALNYKILEWESLRTVEYLPFDRLSFPVTPYASPIPLTLRVFSDFQFHSSEEQERYIKLLSTYPAFINQVRDHLARQKSEEVLIAKPELSLVTAFLNSLIQPGEKSPFYVAADRLPAQSDAFQKRVAKIIESSVNPALTGLVASLSNDYQAQAPDKVGLSQYRGGRDFYNYLVRYHTTLDVTPEQVHEIGLKRVAELNARMDSIRAELKFKGTKADFHKFLKTDPKFIPKTPEQIGETLMKFVGRIEPKLDSYFLRKPEAPYGVARLDPKLEGSMTFGYYEQPTPAKPRGTYYYNAANLNERPLFNSGSLIYHELVPGHHFQINLQAENKSLPEFRKFGGHTAFIEGWAEYSSGLAEEMGMYRDPYEQYGRCAAEMFLTVRLVVDTGMNALGWSREKAIDFMRENLLESETQIQTETLRYSSDIPAQALAYKMGSTKFRELREKSRAALGDRFDIRKFHDLVLGGGSMPMTVLETNVDWFITQQK